MSTIRSLLLAASIAGLAVPALGSGTWTTDTKSEWLVGNLNVVDALTTSGWIGVTRNISDDFTYSGGVSDPLPAYWLYEGNNGFYERTLNQMRLVSGSSKSEWWFGVDTAPKVFQPISGDFFVETYIQYGTAPHDFGAAQLFVMQDNMNWFAAGMSLIASGVRYNSTVTSGGNSSGISNVAGTATATFRISCVGSQLTGYVLSGTSWISIGGTTVPWKPRAAGIFLKDTSVTNAYADFDYLTFSTTRTSATTGIYLSRTIDLGVAPSAAGTIAWVQNVPLGASLAIQTRSSADGVGWSSWSAPYATPAGTPISSPLSRYIQFSATLTENGSLQTPQVDSVSISFPGIAPKSPVLSSPQYVDDVWGNSKATDMAWVEPVDTPAPVWAYYYSIDAPILSGTALVASAAILSKTISGLPVLGLVEGIHIFRLVSQGDPLEYPNSAASLFTIKKDTLPPDAVSITSATHPNASASANDSPIFSTTAFDSVSATDFVSEVAGYYYVLDTLPASVPTASSAFSASSPISFSGLQDGFWVFHCRAKDGAGNLGPVGHYQINISYKGRVSVTIASATHPENQESASNHPEFSLSVSNPDSATLVGFHYVLDGNATTLPTAADAFTTSSSLSFSGLRNQSWFLHVSVKNALGSLSNPTHFNFRVNFQGRLIEEGKIHAVPHPIRSSPAIIRYELMAPASAVEIELLSETGRRLRSVTGTITPGSNSATMDVSDLANGVYLCRFSVRRQDGKSEIVFKKLAIVR